MYSLHASRDPGISMISMQLSAWVYAGCRVSPEVQACLREPPRVAVVGLLQCCTYLQGNCCPDFSRSWPLSMYKLLLLHRMARVSCSLLHRMEKHWQQEYDKDSRKCVLPLIMVTPVIFIITHQLVKHTLPLLPDALVT